MAFRGPCQQVAHHSSVLAEVVAAGCRAMTTWTGLAAVSTILAPPTHTDPTLIHCRAHLHPRCAGLTSVGCTGHVQFFAACLLSGRHAKFWASARAQMMYCGGRPWSSQFPPHTLEHPSMTALQVCRAHVALCQPHIRPCCPLPASQPSITSSDVLAAGAQYPVQAPSKAGVHVYSCGFASQPHCAHMTHGPPL